MYELWDLRENSWCANGDWLANSFLVRYLSKKTSFAREKPCKQFFRVFFEQNCKYCEFLLEGTGKWRLFTIIS